jgi:hypothetical protein
VGVNGVQLNGVMAPGFTLYYRPARTLSFKGVFAYLLTHRNTPGQGSTYGWETDFTGYFEISDHWQLITECNIFNPGDYFRRLTNRKEHIASELILGITYIY